MRMRLLIVLAGLTVTMVGCGGGYGSAVMPSPTPTTAPPTTNGGGPTSTVAIPSGAAGLGANAFGNSPQTVTAGTTVRWTNTDSVPHTSTSDGGAWDSGTIAPGGSFSAVLSTSGTFHYHCAIHPGMIGTITVQ
jgi:plastocyanin